MTDRWTEAKVASVLARRFKAPEYAFVRSVQGGTGASRNAGRQMDAFAMGLWPSRGLARHGFEIKVSRADWLKELKQPHKAEAFARFCHYWWIAVPEATEIVMDLELPDGWGLLEVKGGKVWTVRDAPRREAQDLTIDFIAALLRRCTEQSVDEAALAAAREEGRSAGFEEGKRHGSHDTQRLEMLTARVDAFAKASGIDPRADRLNGVAGVPWEKHTPEALGSAVARLLTDDLALERSAEALHHAEARLEAGLKMLRKATADA